MVTMKGISGKKMTGEVRIIRRSPAALAADGTSIFSKRLKALRTRSNLSQGELADQLRSDDGLLVDRSLVSKWESGSHYPGIGALELVARFFNVSVDFLSGKSEIEQAQERRPEDPSGLRNEYKLLWLSNEQVELLGLFERLKGDKLRIAQVLLRALGEPEVAPMDAASKDKAAGTRADRKREG